ncbi:hypothetical protein [Paracoccus sediminis]|nr:hypothetical protein [Paracoccus sediminis]
MLKFVQGAVKIILSSACGRGQGRTAFLNHLNIGSASGIRPLAVPEPA